MCPQHLLACVLPLLLATAPSTQEGEGWYDCAKTSSVSPSNVQKAWRKLARKTHPDTAAKGSEHEQSDLFNDADKLKTVRLVKVGVCVCVCVCVEWDV